ncbi:disintegrin and metalloproteinase domain-containing protein 9-like [Varanus komodoensis]|uniref:disintegrin and metalloproteinase domain-containing protein 9-like n=1 Tax=Varanus komodoensis TaxID=61221 RepID=UPI001CF7E867|nr:disintegrin and metalloproteinase domain-containing protein 9-like [Varanus komodoensis]
MLGLYLYVVILGLPNTGKQMLTVGGYVHQNSRHSAHEIIIPERLIDRQKRWTHLPEEHLDNQLSYLIQTGNGTHVLKLKKNKNLFGEHFIRYTYSQDGKLEITPFDAKTHCYYHGIVEGAADSVLALSTCDGLRGILFIGGKQFRMEPVNGSDKFEHYFYELDDSHQQPFVCGVPDNDLHHEQNTESFLKYSNISNSPFNKDTLLRKRRAVLPDKRYVELYMVVDKHRYLLKNSDVEAVQKEAVELANYVDGMFSLLNIQIVLIGLEIWKNENPIDVENGSAGDVLHRFVEWRRQHLMGKRRNDVSHLIIGRESYGSTAGMAFVGAVCSPDLGGSISTFDHRTVISQATIVAHELGHNLGMNHDDKNCPGHYIMHSVANGSKNFSSCSSNDFELLILRGKGTCLRNAPKPSDIFTEPVCGNNIVDKNEECDCGPPEKCSSPCCNAITCKLKPGAKCAEGLCCEKCQYKVAGTQCRSKIDLCDLPEYCNGTYADCPEDVYVMDGYPCNNNKHYCYNGICQNYDSQCESLFGKGAKKGANICFERANSRGDTFGNCGMSRGKFVKCTQANSLCGTIHCTSVNQDNLPSQLYIQNYNGISCVTAEFSVGSDFPDPALVHRGTTCAEGKVCVDFSCVNATQLGYSCDVTGKCNDRAVCNNKGNCHCDPGWAPPFCDKSGYGGSIDSGPTHIDTSLRDGLLVFFLLILPLLILAVVAVVKRDAIERRLCRECRRRRRVREALQARQNNAANRPKQPNELNNRQPARSNSGMFTISHFPTPRPPIQSQLGSHTKRPPLRPPPPRPVVSNDID